MRGKDDNAGGMYPQRRDHPRLCGEKSDVEFSTSDGFRITPAYAGKSSIIFLGCQYL